MNKMIRDDNLRLVLSRQEHAYILEKRNYHRQSLVYCCWVIAAGLFYLEVLPLLQIIWPNSDLLLMLITMLWGLVCICTLLMAIPIWLQFWKYQKFMQEHHKFMQKFNRQID